MILRDKIDAHYSKLFLFKFKLSAMHSTEALPCYVNCLRRGKAQAVGRTQPIFGIQVCSFHTISPMALTFFLCSYSTTKHMDPANNVPAPPYFLATYDTRPYMDRRDQFLDLHFLDQHFLNRFFLDRHFTDHQSLDRQLIPDD